MPRDVKVAWLDESTGEVFAPKGRMLYPNLLRPRGMRGQENSVPKFGLTLLIPAGSNIDALKKLAGDAASEKFGRDWTKKKLRSPFLKTEDQERLKDLAEAYPTLIRPSANADFPPFIVGPDAKCFSGPESEIYGGRWCIPTVTAYAYDQAGNKGVSFGLKRVQLLDHDEPIGGHIATASGFEAVSVGGNTADAVWGEDDGGVNAAS